MKCEKCGYELFPFDTKCDKCGAVVNQNGNDHAEDNKTAAIADDRSAGAKDKKAEKKAEKKSEKKSAGKEKKSLFKGGKSAVSDAKISSDINSRKPIVLNSGLPDPNAKSNADAPVPAATPVPAPHKAKKSKNSQNNTKKIIIIIASIAVIVIALGVLGIVVIKPLIQKKIEASKHVHEYVDGVCIGCGENDPDYVPHVHDYVPSVTEPTCTEDGYTTYTCSCGDEYITDETEAKGHLYNPVVTEPTCTDGGYTTYTCELCSDEYIEDNIDPLGHVFENGVCLVCGYEEIPEEGVAGELEEDTVDNSEESAEEPIEESAEEPESEPEPVAEVQEEPANSNPGDKIPKTGESNTPILFVIFIVFSIIGIGYSLYVYAFPSKRDM